MHALSLVLRGFGYEIAPAARCFCFLNRGPGPSDGAGGGAHLTERSKNLRPVNVLCVRLTDACWSRILTELDAAQIFSRNRSTVEELHAAIKDAVFPNPASLDLVAADWRAAENFVLPGGNGAPAATARRDLTPLRFLSLIHVAAIEEPTAALPLGPLCHIVGTLGPCLTQSWPRCN